VKHKGPLGLQLNFGNTESYKGGKIIFVIPEVGNGIVIHLGIESQGKKEGARGRERRGGGTWPTSLMQKDENREGG